MPLRTAGLFLNGNFDACEIFGGALEAEGHEEIVCGNSQPLGVLHKFTDLLGNICEPTLNSANRGSARVSSRVG